MKKEITGKDIIKKEIIKKDVIAKDIIRKERKNLYQLIYKIYMCSGTIFFAGLAIMLSYLGTLEKFDQQASDFIYQILNYRIQEPVVSIIAIDDNTVEALGEYGGWSRSRTADLIELLNGSGAAPTVIGIGLDYSQEKDAEGDAALVEICKQYSNVCISAAVFTDNTPALPQAPLSPKQEPEKDSSFFLKPETNSPVPVTGISLPYSELLPYISTGVINNLQISPDGYTRTAVTTVTYNDTEYDSFAMAAYKMYMNFLDKEVKIPRVDDDNSFTFTYTRKSKDYSVYSFYDVISGNVDLSVFENDIVFIGDYTSADSTFKVPNQRSMQMQGIEVQANILEALLSQKTGQAVPYSSMFAFYAIFAVVFFIATSYSSRSQTFIAATLLLLFQLAVCAVLNLFGYYILILIPAILVIMITIFNLTIRYAVTKRNNYQLESAFKKYVDKSIVNEIVQNGSIDMHIGGVKKDIAVLFVDIRGFTSLSENMEPEQIVEILNKYLTLAANAVAKNNGTLDKFIGDAAMAVFNSPLDLEDYEYKAVCAAWDLLSSAHALNDFCEKQYGKQVAFGIGIHCGKAVIGNIGCESRMDYTAIGDTVNTASRLEGAAAPGQILISAEMKERLGTRILTSFAGEFALKGKKNKVPAYIIEGISETDIPDAITEDTLQIRNQTDMTVSSIEGTPQKKCPGKLYCIPSLAQLSDYAEFSRQYNAAFEYNDFFIPDVLDDEEKKNSIIAQYMSLDRDRSEDTLHGAFLDICINSSDPQIFTVSDIRVHQCMDIARKMGLKAVIFHTNYIVNFRLKSYLDGWLSLNEAYWKKLLQEYPQQQIYIENMFDDTPELLTALAGRMKDEPRFAVCLDTAHAFISGSPLNNWFDSLKPYAAHLHVNDNNRYEDLHCPVGSGSFPWDDFQRWVTSLEHKPSLLIEVRSFEDLQKSVNYMKEHQIYPFD